MLHDSALPSACASAKVSSSPYLFIVSQVMFFPIASPQTAEREGGSAREKGEGARFRVPGYRRAFGIPQWSKRMVNRRGYPQQLVHRFEPLQSLRIPSFPPNTSRSFEGNQKVLGVSGHRSAILDPGRVPANGRPTPYEPPQPQVQFSELFSPPFASF